MPSPERRRLLRASAAALACAGVTGCLGGSGADDEPATTATTTDDWTTTGSGTTERRTTELNVGDFDLPESAVKSVGGGRVAVARAVARKAVAYDSIMGSGGVLAPDGTQFVVAEVQSATDSAPDPAGPPSYDAFELVAGGDRFSPVEVEQRTRGAFTTALAGRGEVKYDDPYADSVGETGVGWLAFELPSPLAADAPKVHCRYGGETAVWPLSDDVAGSLGERAPEFELRSFDASVAADDAQAVDLSLTAENVSDAGGEFLAAVYWPTTIADDDESHVVRQSVGPSERVEWSKTVDAEYAESADGAVTANVEGSVDGTATVAVSGTTTRDSR